MLGVVGEGSFDEGGHGRCFLVWVELDVGEAGVVVNDRVRVVVADSRLRAHPVARSPRAIAGDAVAGPQEARIARDVHVQQIAGTGPLVAVGRLLGYSRAPREPVAAEHLPDRRVREPGRSGDQAWTPAGLSTAVADPFLQLGGEKTRRSVWTAGAIQQRIRQAAAIEPAMPPTMRRRRRDTESGRRLLQRETTLDRAHQRETASQSELGVSVQQHPSPPLSVESGKTHSLKGGPDRTPTVHNLCRHVS